MSGLCFFRSHYLLWALLLNTLTAPDVCPGVIEIPRHREPLGFGWGDTAWVDVITTAEHLTLPPERAPKMRDALKRVAPLERQFAPELCFLRDAPLLELPSESAGLLKLVAPCPWSFEHIAERQLLQRLPQLANSDQFQFLSLRGDAFAAYLREAVRDAEGMLDVDALSGLGSAKRPDLIWLGVNFGVVIEAKVTLSPLTDYEHKVPSSVLKAWQLGCVAIEQGQSLLSRNHRSIGEVGKRRWVLVIATMEPGAADATYMTAASKRWGFLNDTHFAALHVADSAEVEHFTRTGTADDYAHLIIERWERHDGELLSDQAPLRFEERRASAPLQRAWNTAIRADIPPPWDRDR